MRKPKLSEVQDIEEDALKEGFWIVLLKATSVPPHIMVFNNGQFHSLEYDAYHTGDIETIIKLIKTKMIPSVFCKIDVTPKQDVSTYFDQYSELDNITCLYPVKDLCIKEIDEECNACDYVFELIPLLNSKGWLMRCSSVNVELNNGEYCFPIYTKKQIFERIRQLQDHA